MEEDFGQYSEEEDYTESLSRFEQMLRDDQHYFFDVEEFESLIDHYLDQPDYGTAKKVIDFSLKQHPSSLILKLKMAHFFASTHKPRKALTILNAAEKLEPYNLEIFSAKAALYGQLRQHNKAIENYYRVLDLLDDENERLNIYTNIVFEYENLNQYDKAIDILKSLLTKNTENETLLNELAFCYSIQNDIDNSIAFFKDFVDEHPYNYSAWYNLGIAFNRAKLYEKAIDAYDFTIAIKEDFASAYFNKASSLAMLDRHEEAISVYEETFIYEKADSITHYNIGECYEKLGENNLAMANYHKASKLDPYNSDAWAGMAVISDSENKLQSAIYYINKALELEDNNSEFWYIKGDILSKTGLFDEALESYDRVIELDEDNADIWIDKAEMVKDFENLKESLLVLFEAIEKQPTNYLLYTRLVPFLLMCGRTNNAVESLIILLSNKKELLPELMEYYPELVNFPQIVNVLDNFKAK